MVVSVVPSTKSYALWFVGRGPIRVHCEKNKQNLLHHLHFTKYLGEVTLL